MAKKKVVKKAVKEVESTEKFLTQENLKIIEDHTRWLEINKLEHKTSLLEIENRRLKAQLELTELNTKSTLVKKSIDDKIEDHKVFLKGIADELEMKGAWSFNPETGLIIQED